MIQFKITALHAFLKKKERERFWKGNFNRGKKNVTPSWSLQPPCHSSQPPLVTFGHPAQPLSPPLGLTQPPPGSDARAGLSCPPSPPSPTPPRPRLCSCHLESLSLPDRILLLLGILVAPCQTLYQPPTILREQPSEEPPTPRPICLDQLSEIKMARLAQNWSWKILVAFSFWPVVSLHTCASPQAPISLHIPAFWEYIIMFSGMKHEGGRRV